MMGIPSSLLLALLCFSAMSMAFAVENPEDCNPVPSPLPEIPLATVVPQCMATRQPTRDPVELIAQDLRVCQCLQERNALFPRALTQRQTPAQEAQIKSDLLRSYSRSSANVNAMNSITGSSTNENAATNLLTSGEAEVRKLMSRQVPANNPAASSNLTVLQSAAIPAVSKEIVDTNEIPAARRDSQCVTYLEYSSQRELPYDNSFFSYLSSTNTFNANDWKMDSLRQAYDSATNDEVRKGIYARMVYLSRNPRFAAVFSATTVEGVSAAVINQKKTELFNILKRLAPAAGSNCAQVENQCWREAQNSGAYRTFSSQAEQFMLQDDVMDIVSSQMAQNYMNEVQRIASSTPESILPRTTAGYAVFLQSAQEDIANRCTGPTAQAMCYEKFSIHCKSVRAIHDRAASSSTTGADVIEELSASQVVHGLLNPQQNQNFSAFNDMICLQRYTNPAGQSSNFFEFRNRTCPATGAPAECSDRRALLARFLREYNVPLSGANPGDQNVRAGFAAALGRPDFVQLTSAQIDAANRIAESPRALRAQFGGRMPTISGAGKLITPTGSTSRTAPAVQKALSSEAASPVAGIQNPSSSAVRDPSPVDQPQSNRSFTRSNPVPMDDDDSRSQPETRFSRSSQQQAASQPFNPIVQPQRPIIQPQAQPEPDRQQIRRPASVSENDDQVRPPVASPVAAGITGRPVVVDEAAAPTVARSGSAREPQIELPPRRRRSARSDSIRNALLQKYDNVSENSATRQQRELVEKAPIPVSVESDVIASVVNDPATLSSNESIMNAVRGSSDSIVKLSLNPGEGGTPVIVYATKTNDQVTFSFTPPAETTSSRAPASLSDNEMNVKLPDQNLFQTINQNPSRLSGYESVVRSAMSLPGDIVRLNVYVEGGEPVYVYVDKRGPTPVFTTDNQQIIRAYRP